MVMQRIQLHPGLYIDHFACNAGRNHIDKIILGTIVPDSPLPLLNHIGIPFTELIGKSLSIFGNTAGYPVCRDSDILRFIAAFGMSGYRNVIPIAFWQPVDIIGGCLLAV